MPPPRDRRFSLAVALECSFTGALHPLDRPWNLSPAAKPLLVRYDLEAAARRWSRANLARRPPTMWKYHELLPLPAKKAVVSLGETVTPLVPVSVRHRSGRAGEVLIKDDSRLPTGSFKARGLALAVAMARHFGLTHLAMPTNGNAGAALAAYAARAGLRCTVVCPADTPRANLEEMKACGAEVQLVDGLIDDCGRLVQEGTRRAGWFDVSTLKEPYRLEGKKTIGFEIAEQLGFRLPDVIFYPTGGGTGLLGMWKAFSELEAVGLLAGRRPRMVAVQAAGCAPVVRAFAEGLEHAPRWEQAHTLAAGIRVPRLIGDFLVLRVLRESGGFAIAVEDAEIEAARRECAERQGIHLCPEGAATFAAYRRSLEEQRIAPKDRVLLFNGASALKYPPFG